MIRVREEEEEEHEEEEAPRTHGPACKRYENGACPSMSVYQFFVIEKDLDRGYDYRCILHHSMPHEAIVKGCTGNANLLLHMKNSHGFVPANQGPGSKKTNSNFSLLASHWFRLMKRQDWYLI
jgi:hypothetical protein